MGDLINEFDKTQLLIGKIQTEKYWDYIYTLIAFYTFILVAGYFYKRNPLVPLVYRITYYIISKLIGNNTFWISGLEYIKVVHIFCYKQHLFTM